MTEHDWQARVVDAAKLFGWRWAHFRPARTVTGWRTAFSGHAGFPDLVLVRGGRLILAELKAGRGVPTVDQAEWLAAFKQVPGVESYCWHPDDWERVYTCLAKESQP